MDRPLARSDYREFETDIANSAAVQHWRAAASGHTGRGLEVGADLAYLRKHLGRLRSVGKAQRAGLIACIAKGG